MFQEIEDQVYEELKRTKSSRHLGERGNEDLCALLKGYYSLNQYVTRLDDFKWRYAWYESDNLNKDLVEWLDDEINKLTRLENFIYKEDMDTVRMIFNGTIGRYHYESIVMALKEDDEYYAQDDTAGSAMVQAVEA